MSYVKWFDVAGVLSTLQLLNFRPSRDALF